MNHRLLYLVVALALVAACLTGLTLPASAQVRTVTVRMVDGSLVEVTVDVPPGTPLEDLKPKLPGEPLSWKFAEDADAKEAPSIELPPVVVPPAPTDPGADAPDSEGDEGKSRERRHAKRQRKRSADRRRHRRHKARPKVESRRKRLHNGDGSPSQSNPSFFDALPGPAKVTGVPNFVIRKFRVPVFLLPIYQAAGIQYGVRWEVLAAINEIETDYGRNLNVSSAGALGWMQFMPSTWRMYGVDANKDGKKDPYNPVDAIFAAARYLKAAGYGKSVKRAIFAYNHAGWYVDSVLVRARLIAGVPPDVVGSLTGLTEGRFPVYARARYADDVTERDASRRVAPGRNAARVVGDREGRHGIEIYSRRGAPVVSVNDGVVKKVGHSRRLGRYLVLQDVYGNRYTYARLESVSRFYPAPSADGRRGAESHDHDHGHGARDGHGRGRKHELEPHATAVFKDRFFAHPRRPNARRHGGLEQVMNSAAELDGYTTFRNYFSRPVKFDPREYRLKRLRRGSRVIGGTILGRIGKTTTKASHLYFEIRPAGGGAPRIDPKPILDGWKLLEATAIYRARGKNALYSDEDDKFSIGQVLLLPKPMLEKRVLSDSRVDIYPCGRRDIKSGQIDRRVLAMLEYLAESGMRPTVTSLKCGHGFYTKSGNVSHHSSGNAADIAAINGVPILGHSERGGITEHAVRRLMQLQGTMRPDQIISLLDLGANTYAMGDHADHIHVGFRPRFGANRKLGRQTLAVLKPGQWNDLLSRLRQIDNPVVRTKPSRYAIPVKRRGRDAKAAREPRSRLGTLMRRRFSSFRSGRHAKAAPKRQAGHARRRTKRPRSRLATVMRRKFSSFGSGRPRR